MPSTFHRYPAALALWVAPLVLIACASNSQVTVLETRVQELEAQMTRVSRLEQQLVALERERDSLQELASSLTEKLSAAAAVIDHLERALAKLDVRERKQPPPRRPGPDPNTVYAVPLTGSPFRGPKDAKVTIVRGFEFACPYCERSRATMDQLLRDYPKDVRIVYKHFIVHPQVATKPALAACAAHAQNRYFDMENALWDKAFHAGRDFSDTNIDNIARSLKLDMTRFHKDMQSAACDQQVKGDQAMLGQVGMRGTPGFFINGRFLSGARPVDSFRALVDEELKKADTVLRQGAVKQADYYDKYVVASGRDHL